MFEVNTLQTGFYGKLRKKNEIFRVDTEIAIGSWMELTEKGKKALGKFKAEAEKKAKAEKK